MRVTYWCEMAWLPPGEVVESVAVIVDGARVAEVHAGVPAPPGAVLLTGLTLPGLANGHSHAFHRALRGHTQVGRGSFWTWREQMYGVAARLDPDTYLDLARAVYAEMALAGITCVAEFHYLHHGPGGVPYDDPNVMGHVLVRAAREAGLRIVLLDTCYLTGGIGNALTGPQVRFGDGDADGWASRAEELALAYEGQEDVEIGAAIHSVRAVPPEQMHVVVDFTHRHSGPLHVHVSEQRAENEACVEAYSATPVQVLHDHGVLGPRSTAVHATHLSDVDVALLGGSTTHVCMCPTTERDLADGIGPARRLFDAGSPITLGSDSQAVVDLFEEARAVELDERLATMERGHWRAADLLNAATAAGHASLGYPDAGSLVPGAWADLVSVRLDSVRTAGATRPTAAESVVFAATAADVHSVVSGGHVIVQDGRHVLGDVGALLRDAVARVRA
ncbi:formimidoylglutamate deiminase [Planotetraspora kaengkrachanensis]|uniref:Formimidoylglutamate deiminase n=1 Tax=Planotetraspora kaengkrachanensis TaxID=575193 RepID=A0A8J3Q0K8_9ACTN|nr:formimidoylglutamate deiminase [Planotetraspora kaengkrachanensis]GIG84398.1 formimidoylglutamate deiminase [Planotetraspora kaengkrachanensis]